MERARRWSSLAALIAVLVALAFGTSQAYAARKGPATTCPNTYPILGACHAGCDADCKAHNPTDIGVCKVVTGHGSCCVCMAAP